MTTDVHTLSGAYAVNALSAEEAAEFRQHLEGCAVCRDEVAEFREVVARMGADRPVTPPTALRERVLAAASRTAQSPPDVRRQPPPSTAAPIELSSRRRRFAPLLVAAAAAVLVLGGFAGFRVLDDDGSGKPSNQVVLAADAVEVFTASDAKVAVVKTANGGTLKVGISPAKNRMAVDVRDLPKLDSDFVYELWAVQAGVPTAAGVLGASDTGAAMEMPAPGTEIAITVEPANDGKGTTSPTTKPIAQVNPATDV